MKTLNSSYYFLFLGFGLIQSGCQKPIVEYESAINSCIPDTLWKDNEKKEAGYVGLFFRHPTCIIGAQLPEFTGSTMDGKTIDKNYFTGKVSVINFWFIGCHPCEAEIPGFNKLVEKYIKEPVNFLAISRNSPKDVTEFVDEHPFHFEHIAYGEPIITGNFRSKWGYPLTIVADENLKILYAGNGGRDDSLAVKEIQDILIPVIDKALKRG